MNQYTKGGYPPFTGYSGTMVSGGGGGSGDVTGPGSSTDTAIVRFNGTNGKVIENSLALLSDVGNLGVPADGYYNFDTGTLGTSGYGFRDNGGTVEFKNSGGAWSAIPSSVTSGANTFKVSFTFSSGSPVTIAALAAGDVVMITNCTITTPFDSNSATLSIGVTGTPEAVLSASDVSPTVQSNFQTLSPYTATASTNLILTITPSGSTAGVGTITCLVHKV